MLNILIPKYRVRSKLNLLWRGLQHTWIAPYLTHEAQVVTAQSVLRHYGGARLPVGLFLAQALFGRPLRGAGYAWESRQSLAPAPDTAATIATTGANSVDFSVLDFWAVAEIGFVWTVAGTVTTLVMDFDRYPVIEAGGTVVDKLDGTNGVLTAPTVAGQAIDNVLYKDLGDNPGEIDLDKGDSVQAIVTTTTTAGNGLPYVLGFPRAEVAGSATQYIKSN